MTGRVVVVGSLNIDIVAAVERIPQTGETLLGTSLRRLPGGKGANQAVAAAEAGARVALVGCVGDDSDGTAYVDGLAARGIEVSGLRRVDEPTGTALIVVDRNGENTIVVVPGANSCVEDADVQGLDVGSGDVLLLQLEIPLPVVVDAVRRARAAGARVVLNLAPFAELDPDVLDLCDPVVANEYEAAALSRPPRSLVVTLGGRGARWQRDAAHVEIGAPHVDVVDTTGAGDVFVGTLAARLASGAADDDALTAAVAAASDSVTRPGAQQNLRTG
jgi:ribokinase